VQLNQWVSITKYRSANCHRIV